MKPMVISELNNIVYAVGRITSNGTVSLLGTCFLLNKYGFLATASHVTNNDNNNLVIVYSQFTDLTEYQEVSNAQAQVVPATIFKLDPVRDICILKVEGEVIANMQIGGADDVKVTDNIAVVGFPHCINGRYILTYQDTIIGAKVLLESSGYKSKHLVLNILTRPGQSGSPVIRLSDKKVIGMIIGSYSSLGNDEYISFAGVDPSTLHLTTYAISAEYITNMI